MRGSANDRCRREDAIPAMASGRPLAEVGGEKGYADHSTLSAA